jgi:integrase
MSQRAIDGWLDAINNSDNPNIDKEQLACAARLIHDCGLRKNELPGLHVGNVDLDQNGDPIAVQAGQEDNARRIDIPQDARRDIKRCLGSVSASSDPSSPLLPKYQITKTLDRHLKDTLEAGFDEIRDAGKKDAHDRGEGYNAIGE